VEPLPAHQSMPLPHSTPIEAQPGLVETVRAYGPGLQPWAQSRQPQINRRSVLPVEWFRRMPGGGATTYAPPAAEFDDVSHEEFDPRS
jgi:hypothetical protein